MVLHLSSVFQVGSLHVCTATEGYASYSGVGAFPADARQWRRGSGFLSLCAHVVPVIFGTIAFATDVRHNQEKECESFESNASAEQHVRQNLRVVLQARAIVTAIG